MNSENQYRVGPLDQEAIRVFLPHRDPFLFVDKIIEVLPAIGEDGRPTPIGTICRGVKRFAPEMDFFRGHFPGYPITPGVIVTESAGQIGCFVFYPFIKNRVLLGADGEPLKLAGVTNARYRKPVWPGDEIEATIEIKRNRKSIWFFDSTVKVNGDVVAEIELIANFDLKIDAF